MTAAFAPGSVAVLLSPHRLEAAAQIEHLLAEAAQADEAGFDGVLFGEHHGGLDGYLPNPLQLAGWVLGETGRLWAGPCPLLLPLRSTGLVAEEAAWLGARFPGRVAIGVAVGAAPADFAIAEVAFEERAARYRQGVGELIDVLSGRGRGPLATDAAVIRCQSHPIPVVCCPTTKAGVRLGARLGAGIMLDSLSPLAWSMEMADHYRDHGGSGPIVLSRHVWVGAAPEAQSAAEVSRYQSFTPTAMHNRLSAEDSLIAELDASVLAERLAQAREATGATTLSLRVHHPGVGPADIRRQLETLGADVLGLLRRS